MKKRLKSSKGIINFQQTLINWSTRYLGKTALNFIITKITIDIFNIYSKLCIKKKLCHPPKNTITTRLENKITDKYSERKNKANLIAEYSTL